MQPKLRQQVKRQHHLSVERGVLQQGRRKWYTLLPLGTLHSAHALLVGGEEQNPKAPGLGTLSYPVMQWIFLDLMIQRTRHRCLH
jgi:hypothetical protein